MVFIIHRKVSELGVSFVSSRVKNKWVRLDRFDLIKGDAMGENFYVSFEQQLIQQ